MASTERTEAETRRMEMATLAKHPVRMRKGDVERLVRAERIEDFEFQGWTILDA
jgi:hypothetical protein